MWLPLLVVALGLIILYRWHRQSQILQNLSDKYVLITGCDTGFGNLLARQLDQRGMIVLAACLTEKGAENLKKEASSRLQTVILDVSDSQSVSSAAKWVTSIVGNSGLWGLVNNAGIGYSMIPNEWQKKEDFAKVLDVNILGMVDVTLNLLPLIRKARGRVVNVSSGAGRLATVGGGYCISKYGVQAFSDTLRREMLDFGVKVAIIEPGAFASPLCSYDPHFKAAKSFWERVPVEIKESYGENYFQQYVQCLKYLIETSSPQMRKVTDCMEHALTAVYPWTRYSPGWDCKFYYIPVSYLPTALSDYLLCRTRAKPGQEETTRHSSRQYCVPGRWHRQSKILQNLSDKWVLITGSDSGFGNLLAKQLDQHGMLVLAACLTEKGSEELKKEASSRLQTVILDVADCQSVSSAAKWVTNIVGDAGLWGLVNNAGCAFPNGPNEWQCKEDFAKILNVNVLGMVDVTLNMLPLIRRAKGRIVNVASCTGRLVVIGEGSFGISE
ncbi:retinol dehydrogenase 3-like [Pelobates cultripes]|uniref:Retinol dehydrogenase 3-like n=1 Tax=Pelobates cultripes TaxID=61616 RepID=A0AAD1R633_PELCU|nr:retinol dehydrogenase 3-like [Pelobates cultripes]